MATDKNDLPSTPRAEYLAAAADIGLIRDLLAGTPRMHAQYKLYIPKWSAEKPKNYEKRATMAEVYGGLGRSLSASVGMLHAKPAQRSEAGWTPEIEAHWENIDGRGTHGDVFAKRHTEDALADGHVAILVDHPAVPEGVTVTAENEKTLNLRPMWAPYHRADILSWATAIIDNVEMLVQVVLREGFTKRVGKFGIVAALRYRVCRLLVVPGATPADAPTRSAEWELLEERKEMSGEITVVRLGSGVFRDRSGAPFADIPLAIGYAGRTDATLCSAPPLLNLAWTNLAHWRIANDLRFYEALCCYPQPTVEGDLKKDQNGNDIPFQMGPTVVVQVAQGSTYAMTELSGSSLEQLRESLDAKRDEMGELGASFLAKKNRGVETAEAKRIDSVAENATLATASRGYEDMLNQALMFHARYLGIPADQAPTLTLNRDFDALRMDPQTAAVYIQACKDIGFPIERLLEAWQRGGWLAEDIDVEALALEMTANAEAAAEEKAQAAADALALAGGPPKARAA